MTNKSNVKKQTRGWLPKEPTVSFTESTKGVEKPSWRITVPFWAPGLIIVTSLISALFGATLVSLYIIPIPQGPGISDVHVFYSGLYIGILSVVASVLGLSSGFLLLARKYIAIAVTSIVIVFSFGLATLWLPTIDGQPWYTGSIVASPMIASMVALTKLGIDYRKLAKNGNKLPSTQERLLAGLGIAGGGLTVMGIVSYLALFYFPIGQVHVVLLIIGIPLLIGALLSRRTLKNRIDMDELQKKP
jgi:hypothetical protein